MLRLSFVVLAFGLCSIAWAQVATFADVKAQHGVQLRADELRQLMPGAKVVHVTPGGSSQRWNNKPDGTFLASSDGEDHPGGRRIPSSGQGTWRVTDDGKLCVTIQWQQKHDDWCRRIFKVGGKYYAVPRLEDSATAYEYEFSH